MESVRIGLIGAGVIGTAHSAVFHEIERVIGSRLQLVALADPVERHRTRCAEAYGYRHLFADGLDLIRNADINTAFICTPTRYHAELLHSAAARGLNIFCEKPLAMNYPEAVQMVAAAERAQIHSQIGLVLRFSAVYTVMRALIRDPAAGRPLAVLFRDDQCFPIRGVHNSSWRADPTFTAGGTLIEHGVHDLDLLTWLFGPVAHLRAWEQNRSGHPGIEDYMAVEVEFADGLRAQVVNIWHNMLERPSNRRLEIFCDNAFIASEHDMSGDILHQVGDNGQQVMPADEVLRRFVTLQTHVCDALRDWYGIAYLVQDLSFIEALLADRRPSPDLRIGLEAQRLAAAVYHAARTGEEVALAEFTVES